MKDFKAQTHIETTNTQEYQTLKSIEATQEGLQNDKPNIKDPTIIPTAISQNTKDQRTTNRTS
jgi:hypothetical protein